MRRSLVVLAVIASTSVGCATPARGRPAGQDPEFSRAEPMSRHVTLLVGERWLDEDVWHPLDDQLAFGVELDEFEPSSGHGYEIGLLTAGDETDGNVNIPGFGAATDAEFDSYEVYGGYRHTFRAEEAGLHPYVGVGLSLQDGELDIDLPAGDIDDSDTAMGAYLRVGMLWDVSERVRFGLDVRHVFADDWEFANSDVEADYDQAMLTVGWAF